VPTPYASIDDVRALNTGRTIATSTTPNASQVWGYLEETAAVLDGILREKNYALPIATTATGALKLLEHFNALGGHCLTEQAAPTSDRKDSACALWENAQKMLKDGLIELEAERDLTQAAPRAPATPSPFFTREMQF
jgi:hypothetical protein